MPTVSGSYTNGVTLTSSIQNPTTITGLLSAGTLAADVLLGSADVANWTIDNTGTVFGPSGNGIDLDGGGTLFNGATALIAAYSYAVLIGAANTASQPGMVVNAGSILSTSPAESAIVLGAGGIVTNQAGALIADVHGRYAVYVLADAGTVTNAGTFGGGVVLAAGGSLTNTATGTIACYGQGVLTDLSAGSVVNAGFILGGTLAAAENGIDLAAGGSVRNLAGGLITGFNAITVGGTAASVYGSVSNSGTLIGQYGGGIQFLGTATAPATITNEGVISGTIGVDFGQFAGPYGETVANLGSIAGSAGIAIRFSAGPDSLVVGSAASFTGAIAGLAAGDSLIFEGIDAGTAAFAAGTLSLEDDTGATLATLDLAGTITPAQFAVLATPSLTEVGIIEAAGGIPCFAAGTRIATPSGEVAIEQLAIGDEVTTLAGHGRPIKWIGRRSYDGRFIRGNRQVLPIIVRAGALAAGIPCRDLAVSPAHALFLRGLLVPAWCLVNGVSIIQLPSVDSVAYLHLEFDAQEIIFADGAATESFVDCRSRLMFQNAAEFDRLYPQDLAAPVPFCAPRVESGAALDAVRRSLARRAGLAALHVDDAAADGPLDGRVDEVDHHHVAGWAFDSARPNTPVWLEILDNGYPVGAALADTYRPDLEAAGKGSGRCSFVFHHRNPLSATDGHIIEVRRRTDGEPLTGTPLWLTAAPRIARPGLAQPA